MTLELFSWRASISVMLAYRVSRNTYKVGDEIWEAEIGTNELTNILIFEALIISEQQEQVYKILNNQPEVTSAYKEAYIEIVRQQKFPQHPIRFRNMMVFPELISAKYFKEKFRNPFCQIYELEIPEDVTPFSGDMNMLDRAKVATFSDMNEMAESYWNKELTDIPIIEMVLQPETKTSVIRIL